jgi:phosphatidylcholine synthase
VARWIGRLEHSEPSMKLWGGIRKGAVKQVSLASRTEREPKIARRTARVLALRTRTRRQSSPPTEARTSRLIQQILGWCVHGYTALGLVAAAAIAVLLVRGGADAYRWSFLLMIVATFVDSTDGAMARRVRIKEAVPSFDGRRLDDLVDFLNYTCLPLLLVWRARILPEGYAGWLLLPLLASAYGFCQVEAKTNDGYFLGFPSLWNAVALYLYVLPIGSWSALAVVIVLAVLTFVPTRHLYPSQPGSLNRAAIVLGGVWALLVGWIVWNLPQGSETRVTDWTERLAYVSLFYPVFYLGASWTISLLYWKKHLEGKRKLPRAALLDGLSRSTEG